MAGHLVTLILITTRPCANRDQPEAACGAHEVVYVGIAAVSSVISPPLSIAVVGYAVFAHGL